MTQQEAIEMADAVNSTAALASSYTVDRVDKEEVWAGNWIVIVWFEGYQDPCILGDGEAVSSWLTRNGKRIIGVDPDSDGRALVMGDSK